MISSPLTRVEWDHPDAVRLREQMVAEVSEQYVDDHRDGSAGVEPESVVLTGLIYDDERPIAHVALRRLGNDLEIKRMYVVADARGMGLSKQLLLAAEQAARAEGVKRVILHTGTRQTAAIALYEANGYTSIPVYEPYVDLPLSLCFEKVL